VNVCWCGRSVISDDQAETLCRYHQYKRELAQRKPLTEAELTAAERADWEYRQELREWDRMHDLPGRIGGGGSYISGGY